MSTRGASNLRAFNAKRHERNLLLIRDALKRLRKTSPQRTLAHLVEYVSSSTGIHRTNLIRNKEYKSLLIDKVIARGGINSPIPDEDAAEGLLRARLYAATLEISNLREKNRRVEAYLKAANVSVKQQSQTPAGINTDYYSAFANTATALKVLLDRLKDTIKFDPSRGTIEDLAAPVSRRVIVGPPRLSDFVRWLQDRDLPTVDQEIRCALPVLPPRAKGG